MNRRWVVMNGVADLALCWRCRPGTGFQSLSNFSAFCAKNQAPGTVYFMSYRNWPRWAPYCYAHFPNVINVFLVFRSLCCFFWRLMGRLQFQQEVGICKRLAMEIIVNIEYSTFRNGAMDILRGAADWNVERRGGWWHSLTLQLHKHFVIIWYSVALVEIINISRAFAAKYQLL